MRGASCDISGWRLGELDVARHRRGGWDDSLSKVLGDEHKYRSVVATIKCSWPLTCHTGSSRAQRLGGMSVPTVQSWKKNQTHRQVT